MAPKAAWFWKTCGITGGGATGAGTTAGVEVKVTVGAEGTPAGLIAVRSDAVLLTPPLVTPATLVRTDAALPATVTVNVITG